jgi:hypothetical protein
MLKGKIEGPLALRINIWEPEKRHFISPSWNNFVWPSAGELVYAKCVRSPKCGKDPENPELLLLEPTCSCGIYSSHQSEIIGMYIRNKHAVWTIIEGWGSGLMYTAGMRSPAVEVIGIVNMESYLDSQLRLKPRKMVFGGQSAALAAAVDYFKVPIFTYNEAKKLIQFFWEQHGGIWEEHFLS